MDGFGRVGGQAGGDRVVGPMQMIRRIFVPLTGGDGDVAALAAAFTTARQLAAHVDAALLRFDQRYVRPKLNEPLPPVVRVVFTAVPWLVVPVKVTGTPTSKASVVR